MSYQPITGARCTCKPGVHRSNCPDCEGTGWVIDFAKIRARAAIKAQARQQFLFPQDRDLTDRAPNPQANP